MKSGQHTFCEIFWGYVVELLNLLHEQLLLIDLDHERSISRATAGESEFPKGVFELLWDIDGVRLGCKSEDCLRWGSVLVLTMAEGSKRDKISDRDAREAIDCSVRCGQSAILTGFSLPMHGRRRTMLVTAGSPCSPFPPSDRHHPTL